MVITCTLIALFIIFPHWAYFTYVLMFLLGCLSPIRVNVGFIYGLETARERYANVYGSLYNTFDGTPQMIFALYFEYISTQWRYLIIVFLIIAIGSTALTFYMPESPKLLVARGEYDKAKLSYNVIARINKKKGLTAKDKFIQEKENDQSHHEILKKE